MPRAPALEAPKDIRPPALGTGAKKAGRPAVPDGAGHVNVGSPTTRPEAATGRFWREQSRGIHEREKQE